MRSTAIFQAGFNITGAPGAPTIASFSTDSGMVGDHITNDNTLTLTGTAAANSTVNVYDGATLLGTAAANSQRGVELHHRHLVEWHAQLHRDRYGVWYHQRGVCGFCRHRRHGGAGSAGD